MTRDKELVAQTTANLEAMTGGFCDKFLNAEYKELSSHLIRKLARKRIVPFLSGHLDIWAAGVIYALGQINFLFDPSVTPHMRAADLCKQMGMNLSTIAQKAKYIRDILKMHYFDPEFSTQAVRARDPYMQMAWSLCPPYVQNYRNIRRLQKDLQQDVIHQHVTRPLIDAAGHTLGILDENHQLHLENPDEANIVMDFIIYESWESGGSAVQAYAKNHSNASEVQREILEGMIRARTSLFQIQAVDGIFLTLQDLLLQEGNRSRNKEPLADIGLSQSIPAGTLLFIRVLPFSNFQITSGVIFPFDQCEKARLLETFNDRFQACPSNCVNTIEKYAFFFKQYRKCGIPISYLDA